MGEPRFDSPMFVSHSWSKNSQSRTHQQGDNRWGSYGNIISFAADGDILAGGLFGIKRWNIGQDK